ncbi:MAG TPA: dihydroorotase [Bacteroidia bacterium]|nr:dihydroorotase [Bacteroidia bacterium]
MQLLIKSATIIDPNSSHKGKVQDVLIENGTITDIKAKISASGIKKVVEAKDLHLSPGWFDMQANFCDPGFEYKEDLSSGMKAAAAGGFTGVALVPSTSPPLYSKSQVEYIVNKTSGNIVDVHPIGALSHKLEGKNLSEMYDMKLSGAVAFTDDIHPVMSSGLLYRALLYTKSFGGLIISRCNDTSLATGLCVNEGKVSVMLGLKGEPSIAEEIMVTRDLFIAEYSDARLHITSISTEGSVNLIRSAKKKGLPITSSVNAYNLAFEDSELLGWDTNFKVSPPLRGRNDIKALQKALADGTIDVICSDHRPEDEENKKLEFDLSTPGMLGIQTMYPLVNVHSGLSQADIITKIAINPRKILGLEIPTIEKGSKANITLFSPSEEWIPEKKHIQSQSYNTPVLNKKLKGRVVGIINHDTYTQNHL